MFRLISHCHVIFSVTNKSFSHSYLLHPFIIYLRRRLIFRPDAIGTLLRILVFSSKKQVVKHFFSQETQEKALHSSCLIVDTKCCSFLMKMCISSNWNEMNLDEKCVNINTVIVVNNFNISLTNKLNTPF